MSRHFGFNVVTFVNISFYVFSNLRTTKAFELMASLARFPSEVRSGSLGDGASLATSGSRIKPRPLGDRTNSSGEHEYLKSTRAAMKMKNALPAKINTAHPRVEQVISQGLTSPDIQTFHKMRKRILKSRTTPPRTKRNMVPVDGADVRMSLSPPPAEVKARPSLVPTTLDDDDSAIDEEKKEEDTPTLPTPGSIFARLERIEKELDAENDAATVAEAIVDNAISSVLESSEQKTSEIAPPSSEMREYAYSLLQSPPPSTISPSPMTLPATPSPVKVSTPSSNVNFASPYSPTVDAILREGSPSITPTSPHKHHIIGMHFTSAEIWAAATFLVWAIVIALVPFLID